MREVEQLQQWVKGNPIHNKKRDECCPDFSCCSPGLLAPKEVRETFYNAYIKGNNKVTDRLLMEFLSKMIEKGKKPYYKIHIAGLEASRREL